MANEKMWTLVQHTGFSVGQKHEFRRAVELREISQRQGAMVKALGGVVFDTYEAAREAEEAENWPPGTEGIIPNCAGSFIKMKVNSEKLYIPKGGGT